MSKDSRKALEERVVAKIVDALEAGVAPWVKPWKTAGLPVSAYTGKPYRGINILLLMDAMDVGGFSSNRWLTFNQVQEVAWKMMAKDLGKTVMADAPEIGKGKRGKYAFAAYLKDALERDGKSVDDYPHVMKGSKSSEVIFQSIKEVEKKVDGQVVYDEDGKPKNVRLLIRRSYRVFNTDQVANCPAVLSGIDGEAEGQTQRFALDAELESALEGALPGVTFEIGGDRAFYRPSQDMVRMPNAERFDAQSQWYSTKMHECVHATGHSSRLDRGLKTSFGSKEYAAEELVAELGSAFLCAHLGIDGFLQHPEYIGNWLTVLKNDHAELFRAAGRAQKAADFMLKGMGLAETEYPAKAA